MNVKWLARKLLRWYKLWKKMLKLSNNFYLLWRSFFAQLFIINKDWLNVELTNHSCNKNYSQLPHQWFLKLWYLKTSLYKMGRFLFQEKVKKKPYSTFLLFVYTRLAGKQTKIMIWITFPRLLPSILQEYIFITIKYSNIVPRKT